MKQKYYLLLLFFCFVLFSFLKEQLCFSLSLPSFLKSTQQKMEPDKTTVPQDVEEVYDIESVDKDDEEELIADKDEKTTETQDKQIIQKAQKS